MVDDLISVNLLQVVAMVVTAYVMGRDRFWK